MTSKGDKHIINWNPVQKAILGRTMLGGGGRRTHSTHVHAVYVGSRRLAWHMPTDESMLYFAGSWGAKNWPHRDKGRGDKRTAAEARPR